MLGKYQVKGSTIRSKLEFAAERCGSEARENLAAYLSAQAHPTILDAEWYSFSLYDGLLRKLAADFLGDDLSRLQEVGIYSAEKALTTTYEAFAARRDFPLFLKKISTLHNRFYSTGTLVVVDSGEDFCELEIRDAPIISRADVYLAAGFYIGAARLMGHDRAQVAFEVYSSRVHFRVAW